MKFAIEKFLTSLSFQKVLWLFPLAFTIHVAEEICCFTAWAQKHATLEFSFDDYLKIHLSGIVSAFLSALILRFYPHKFLIFFFCIYVRARRFLERFLSRRRDVLFSRILSGFV